MMDFSDWVFWISWPLTVVIIGVGLWRKYARRQTQQMINEFEKNFPGECPICSYHNFGLMEGYVSGPAPAHSCPRKGAK